MKCPLIAIAIVREKGEPLGDEADCLPNECAWWDAGATQCIVVTLTQCVGFVGDKLGFIAQELTLLRHK
jgi:hypothetical protein